MAPTLAVGQYPIMQGKDCSERMDPGSVFDACPNNCSGAGTCVMGFCRCKGGMFGADCSRTKVLPASLFFISGLFPAEPQHEFMYVTVRYCTLLYLLYLLYLHYCTYCTKSGALGAHVAR